MSEDAISPEDFAVLMSRVGLKASPEETEELRKAYRFVLEMAERVRTPRGREAEPAHIFSLPYEGA